MKSATYTHCHKCGVEIPRARQLALPGTKTCTQCSEVKPVKGFMTWEHKTAPTFNLTEDDDQFNTYKKFTRKGVHASLPLGRKTGGPESLTVPDTPEYTVHNQPMARCHPDRPAIGPDRKCVECAQRWYALRSGFRK